MNRIWPTTAPFGNQPHLAVSDDVHRLISRDPVQRTAYGPEPEASGNTLLDETMILFQDIIQVRRWPAAPPPAQLPSASAFALPVVITWRERHSELFPLRLQPHQHVPASPQECSVLRPFGFGLLRVATML
jgi:hypothetical protein